jgi:tRNA 5-methylaminomethyl-2-thiouridine biosynthesis bifunctional protein
MPVASDGYVVPLADGRLLFGATSDLDDVDPSLREADHQRNIERLQRMLPGLGTGAGRLHGRVGWRVRCSDRLPLAGPLPDAAPLSPTDRLARWPRSPGVYMLTALGSRGLSLAALLGELLAAQICGTPSPLTQDLADAVDPARFLVREHRRS